MTSPISPVLPSYQTPPPPPPSNMFDSAEHTAAADSGGDSYAPDMFHQKQACIKCKMYPGQFVPPCPAVGAQDAKLLVIYDSPNKKDAKNGAYMSEEAGVFFKSAVEPWVDTSTEVCVYPAVRCFLHRVNAKTPEAKKCWQLSGMRDLMAVYPNVETKHKKRVLLLGYWPCKLATNLDLRELHGKIFEKDGVSYGVAYSPAFFIAKHVRWAKEGGKWLMIPSDGMQRAETEWRQHILPIMRELFSEGQYASVSVGGHINFPHTLVHAHDPFLRRLQERKGKLVHLDVETYPSPEEEAKGRTALDWFYGPETCRPLCMGVAFFDSMDETGYADDSPIPDYDPKKVCVYTGQWTTEIAQALHESKLFAFNATYDTGALYQHTGVLTDIYADPCDMGYVVNQTRKRYSLDSLAYEYVPAWAGWGKAIKGKYKNFSQIDPNVLRNYNAGDNAVSSVLFFKLQQEIHRIGADFVYWKVHAGTKSILRDMEARGMNLDYGAWREVCADIGAKVEAAHAAIYAHPWVAEMTYAGSTFNPRSTLQLTKIFNSKYGEGVIPSTKKEVLQAVVKANPELDTSFIKLLLEMRDHEKAYGIYVKTFEQIMERDKIAKGRACVYSSFKTVTTATGRSSSGGGDPVGLGKTKQINIQNVPRGGGLRRLFISRPGYKLAYADYGQIEVRVAGAYARSQEIVDVCLSGRDFHGSVASKAFGMPFEDVMAEDEEFKKIGGTSTRTKAKAITFGLIYGMQAEALAVKIKCSPEEAQCFIDAYFSGMPSIKTFIDNTHAFVREHLHVRTSFGRIRRFDMCSNATLRESVNTLVQASASDIFQLSLQASADIFRREGLFKTKIFPWCEVHDSTTFEFHNSIPDDEIKGMMSYAMTTHVRRMFPEVDEFMWKVPLEADFKFDTVWH